LDTSISPNFGKFGYRTRYFFAWGISNIHPSYLTRFRQNESFPAFSETDIDPVTLGRQPDPGDGDAVSGDPWGLGAVT
jgi:hypothetical protein